jgi:uncharacterized protein YkwD
MARRLATALAAVNFTLLVVCSGAYGASICPTDSTRPASTTSADSASALLCDINALRASQQLPPLQWSEQLASAAQGMAEQMVAQHFFGHVTPAGRTLEDRVDSTGYMAPAWTWSLGEDLGWGDLGYSTPFAVVVGWWNSDEHRANILDPDFRDIGIGVATGDVGLLTGGVGASVASGGAAFVADFGSREIAPPVQMSSRDAPPPAWSVEHPQRTRASACGARPTRVPSRRSRRRRSRPSLAAPSGAGCGRGCHRGAAPTARTRG